MSDGYAVPQANWDETMSSPDRDVPAALWLPGSHPELNADLVSFRPPLQVQGRVTEHPGADATFHAIENGTGPINLDFYPVHVRELPRWPDGSTMTPEEVVDQMRRHLEDFLAHDQAAFCFYDKASLKTWASNDPTGAIMRFDIGVDWWNGEAGIDGGSVAVTAASPLSWTFSTLWTDEDFGHPVSGNRAFGADPQEDGTLVVYTRGADRATSYLDSMADDLVFRGADELWSGWQQRFADWVNERGGWAEVQPRVWERHAWDDVKEEHFAPTTRWLTHALPPGAPWLAHEMPQGVPGSATGGDVDDDGVPDMSVALEDDPSISAAATHGVSAGTPIQLPRTAGDPDEADVDGDGVPDMSVALEDDPSASAAETGTMGYDVTTSSRIEDDPSGDVERGAMCRTEEDDPGRNGDDHDDDGTPLMTAADDDDGTPIRTHDDPRRSGDGDDDDGASTTAEDDPSTSGDGDDNDDCTSATIEDDPSSSEGDLDGEICALDDEPEASEEPVETEGDDEASYDSVEGSEGGDGV